MERKFAYYIISGREKFGEIVDIIDVGCSIGLKKICCCFSGNIIPSGIAADSYKKAVDSAIEKLRKLEEEEATAYGDDHSNNIKNNETKPPS